MTLRQLRVYLNRQLKLAEPIDHPSTMNNPQRVATTAAKKTTLLGFGSGELVSRAQQVESASECAVVLADCIVALPDEGPTDPDYLTPADVARILGVSEDKVGRWIRSGDLQAASLSDNRRQSIVRRCDLEDFLASRSAR